MSVLLYRWKYHIVVTNFKYRKQALKFLTLSEFPSNLQSHWPIPFVLYIDHSSLNILSDRTLPLQPMDWMEWIWATRNCTYDNNNVGLRCFLAQTYRQNAALPFDTKFFLTSSPYCWYRRSCHLSESSCPPLPCYRKHHSVRFILT